MVYTFDYVYIMFKIGIYEILLVIVIYAVILFGYLIVMAA
jgi:hypothetical protein